MKIVNTTFIGLLLVASTAVAGPKAKKGGAKSSESAAPMAKASYGMAGCGLGGQIIKDDEQFPQLIAMTLNGISTNQLSALTSGTSGCAEKNADVALMEQNVFVSANLATISREAAQGNGEQLAGLAVLFGCSGDEELRRLEALSHDKYEQIFSDQNPSHVVNRYRNEIRKDQFLGKSCQKVG